MPYPSLANLPWYTVAGAADWAGNLTGAFSLSRSDAVALFFLTLAFLLNAFSAELGLNGTVTNSSAAAAAAAAAPSYKPLSPSSFLFPHLFYSFQSVVPFSGDTVEFIFIDTESLTGGVNPQPAVLPPLYFPPPPGSLAAVAGPAEAPTAAPSIYGGLVTPATAAAALPYGGAFAGAPSAAPNAAGDGAVLAGGPAAAPAGYGTGPFHRRAASRRSLRQAPFVNGDVDSSHNPTPLDDPAAGNTSTLGYGNPGVNADGWVWLQNALNASYADWIVVVGNHPVWSAGPSGPTWELADKLGPMLEAAGVAAYVSAKARVQSPPRRRILLHCARCVKSRSDLIRVRRTTSWRTSPTCPRAGWWTTLWSAPAP